VLPGGPEGGGWTKLKCKDGRAEQFKKSSKVNYQRSSKARDVEYRRGKGGVKRDVSNGHQVFANKTQPGGCTQNSKKVGRKKKGGENRIMVESWGVLQREKEVRNKFWGRQAPWKKKKKPSVNRDALRGKRGSLREKV